MRLIEWGNIGNGYEEKILIRVRQMNTHRKVSDKVAISDVTLDESIYPREKIDHKRVSIFSLG